MSTSSIGHFKEISITTDISVIQKSLQGYSKELIQSLIIDRRGAAEDSNMTAWGLHQVLGNKKIFQVASERGLLPMSSISSGTTIRHLDLVLRSSSIPPKHSIVEGLWDKTITKDGAGNNILGGNGKFIVDSPILSIPVIEATEESLSYYGATLLRNGEYVSFPEKPYPIWAMTLGKNYVDSFLMTDVGHGFYVEYHHDQPHFHMPLSEDASGFYILGKKVAENILTKRGTYHFTGFKIPFGTAVYTSGGVIHCDAALVGKKWIVGYAPAEDFSTVNVCTSGGTMARFSPKINKKKFIYSRL